MTTTQTTTGTYTVIDIRTAFEGFDADVRMIAKRTGKWTTDKVDSIVHDVIILAESKYLRFVDLTLLDQFDKAIRATRFTVNEDGKGLTSDRPGQNDWTDIPNTKLVIILAYSTSWDSLSTDEKLKFQTDNKFKINWVTSTIDTKYSHLKKEDSQLYASKGYELQKTNFK